MLGGWSEPDSLGRHLRGKNELEHRIPLGELRKPSALIPRVRMKGTRLSASSQFSAPDAILHTHSTPSGGEGSGWTLASDLRGGDLGIITLVICSFQKHCWKCTRMGIWTCDLPLSATWMSDELTSKPPWPSRKWGRPRSQAHLSSST